tara:strand:- start:15 stop:1901 length:1887 start_codon:yes stop_codon:yes gene_type:complete
MSRVKKQVLSKLKEYANKMGRDHLGGDDIPGNKKRGGLRDNDGYDNVQYNRDMPQDEARDPNLYYVLYRKIGKSGNPASAGYESKKDAEKFAKSLSKTHTTMVLPKQMVEGMESANEQGVGTATVFLKNQEELDESFPNMKQWWKEDKKEIMTFIYFLQRQLPPSSKDKYEKSWKDIVVQLQKRTPAPKSIYTKLLDESVNEVVSADAYTISSMMGTAQQSTQNFIDDNKIDVKKLKSYIKNLSPTKMIIIKDIIHGSTDSRLGNIKKGFIKQVKESVVNESTLLGEFLQEGGLPQNWMAGRVSDYHTKLRGKKRNYDDTNFAKVNTGQPDIPDEELDEENANGKFDTVLHLKLLTKAMKEIPGSNKQKDIIRQLNVIRKSGGMKPLKETAIEEYASRLSNSYILDDESILKGTPEDKDAIDRDIDESLKDMVGDTYTFSIGSGDEKWIKPNTKEYVIEKIAETIKHNLYDWDFSLNGIDGSQAKEYSKIFDNDVLKPLLRNIDKTLKTYFKIDSKNKKISWKLSFRDNDKIIDAFFKKNKKISSDIRDSYFSQNEVAKRDYKDEYKKFQSSTKSKKYRAELNKYNRDKGTYGNGDNKDASHKGGKIVGFESESKNRGRAEKSRLKKK